MVKSTKSPRRRNKPPKPYPDFPLFAHATGRWAKKIRGKFCYFGYWNKSKGGDWQAALDLYQEQRDDLHAGRTPRANADGLTVADLCNQFLNFKRRLVDTGEIQIRTFAGYRTNCEHVVGAFGRNRLVVDLAADDFGKFRGRLAEGRGPVALGNEIRLARMVFKYAFDAGLIDRPVRFSPQFRPPSKSVLRRERAKHCTRMFEADEIRRILDAADPVLKTMTLLGINCGFGQSDVSSLPQTALDLDGGWIDYPRPKTGVERRCPLWPETVEALRRSLVSRPEPKGRSNAEMCFLTKYGNRWTRTNPNGTHIDSVGLQFKKVLRRLGINGKRNFYALRHTFQTIGEEAGETATRHIMGHADSSMAGVYRERISDERLLAVTEAVHKWLFDK